MTSQLGRAQLGRFELGGLEEAGHTVTGTSPIASSANVPNSGAIVFKRITGGSNVITTSANVPSAGRINFTSDTTRFLIGSDPITSSANVPTTGYVKAPKTVAGSTPISTAANVPSNGRIRRTIAGGIHVITTSANVPSAGALLRKHVEGHDPITSAANVPSNGAIVRAGAFYLYIRRRNRPYLKVNSMDIRGDLNGRHTASFQLECEDTEYRPNPFDPVLYQFGRYRIFAGFVEEYTEEYYNATGSLLLNVTCTGPTFIPERRHYGNVFEGPTLTLFTIVQAIFAATLSQDGYTLELNEDVTVTIDRLVFEDEAVTDCLNRIAGIFECDWSIDMYFVLRMEKHRFRLGPLNFRDDDGNWSDMKVTRSGKNYRNRQGARTAVPASGQRIQTIVGNGTHTYNLNFTVVNKPLVTVNAASKIVIASEDIPTTAAWDFAWEDNSNILTHRGSQTAYTSTDTIVVTAVTPNLDVYWTENTAEITRMQQRYGGTGLVEAVSKATNIRDQGGAAAFNRQMLKRVGAFEERITVDTSTAQNPHSVGWEVGQSVNVYTSRPRVANQFVIQGIQIREIDKTFLKYSLTLVGKEKALVTGLNVQANTIDVTIDRGGIDLEIGNTVDLTGIGGGIDGSFPVTGITGSTVTLETTFTPTTTTKQVIGITVSGGTEAGTWEIYVYVDHGVTLAPLCEVNQQVTIADVNDTIVISGYDSANREWRIKSTSSTTALIIDGHTLDPGTFDYSSTLVNGGTVTVARTSAVYTLTFAIVRGGGMVPITIVVFLQNAKDANIIAGDSLTIASVTGNSETVKLNNTWNVVLPYQSDTFSANDRSLGPPRSDMTGFAYDHGGTATFGFVYDGGEGGTSANIGEPPEPPEPLTGGPEPFPEPFGGNISTGNGGGELTGPSESGTLPEATALMIINVVTSTREVQTDRAHGFATSYPNPDSGDVVAIWGVSGCGGTGVNDGSNINTPTTRITVTDTDKFVAEDVGNLGGAPGFVDDQRGRVDKTDNIIRGSLGSSEASLLNMLAAAASAAGTNLVGNTATFLLPAEPLAAATNVWTQSKDYQVVESVTLQMGTPSTGADYVADLKLNGVSIFATGAITSPDGSGDVIVSTDFTQHPLVVKKGDTLQPDVVSVGDDNPGCDAVMNVNLRG